MSPSSTLAVSSAAPPPSAVAIARQLLHHAWPVLVAQVLSMGMMIADTLIAGRYGTADLAAVAIGNGLYISVVMLLVGILQAVAPTIAHHVGGGRTSAIGPALQQGFWLALMLAVPGCLVLGQPETLLRFARVPPEIAEGAGAYLRATAFGLPAVLLYRTFYAFNNAVGRPRVLMVISFIAVCVHVPLAWALTHGLFGFAGLPALGGIGCGISTAIVSWLGLGCGLLHLLRSPAYRQYAIFSRWQAPRPREIGLLLRLGMPMGFSTFIEITSFTLIALFAARLGSEAVAGHRVVANLSALVYMLPLAMSIATLVLVGQAAGAHDWARARATVKVSLWLSSGFAMLIGIGLWLLREPVIGLSSTDPAVRTVALGLIVYICIYQLTDAIQTVAAHALRGFKVTLLPMLLHTLCFWGVGLGGGYWATYHAFGREAAPSVAGFWEASVAATVLASVLFGWLLLRVMGRQQAPPST
ncbi:MATE family efflux transporter [Thauera sp. SDU_THAU2]|uniref:MATE family efflux transporter n=1 Tax=Thauera sp. SDU_THAU2 TaxID=3136633 RepID=UPI00311E18EE